MTGVQTCALPISEEGENIEGVIGIVGFSFAGMAQNMGMAFAQLKDWSLRPRADQSVDAILGRAMQRFARIKEGIVISFNLPAVPSLGLATGFDLFLQDRAGLGHAKLLEARNQLLGLASQNPNLVRVRPNGMDDVSRPSRSRTRPRQLANRQPPNRSVLHRQMARQRA